MGNAAACTALGNTKSREATAPLVKVLQTRSTSARVRAAAAEALGRLGRREALPVVAAATADWSPAVAREAVVARQRLERAQADG